ncbi:MAG: deoxyhypusine synthase [Candidatus Korarchaeota archaeon]|nr:deoxyhypusine synthase [Candidatus Korarchaeota archaeon]
MRRVEDITLRPGMTASDIIGEMEKAGGFTAKFVAEGVSILERMVRDPESVNFLSFPADIVSTGVRGILVDMLRRNLFDVVITTGGTIDHDIARCFADYYHGSFDADDSELYERRIHRLGNVFIPFDNYGPVVERFVREEVPKVLGESGRRISPSELLHSLGEKMCPKSILRTAYEAKAPIFSPGLLDSSFGTALSFLSQESDFHLDFIRDVLKLADLSFTMKVSGALVLGGGISKHHTIWWNQFKGGLDYVVYLTTAVEWDGSLSGAREREAISWGKVSKRAVRTFIPGEVSALLPLMYAALLDRISDFQREGRQLIGKL